MHNVKSTPITAHGRTGKPEQFQVVDCNEIVDKRLCGTEGEILQKQYRCLWTFVANSILGLWLLTSPALYHYGNNALVVSDIVSGALIVIFELLSFSPKRCWLRWLTPATGLWLLFAPIVFWSPSPAIYLVDTVVGSLIVAFSILIPGSPGRAGLEKPGPDQPPDWSYNPSSWIRRWLGIALALVGFLIARYLAACQLGYIEHSWDPFFGSSDRVLHSSISRSLPISDAGLGSVAYVIEMLAGFMGDRARWRTAPWVVMTFAILVLPLGATSIILVVLQPVVVHAWCGLCLIAAAGLLISVPLAVHELIAMGQFLSAAKDQGKSVWNIFWNGGTIIGAGATDPDRTTYTLAQRWIASVQGVTVPSSIAAQLAIGTWLMAQPSLLHLSGIRADSDHILGALVVTVAAIATAEVTRMLRLLNIPLGICLFFAALLFTAHPQAPFLIEMTVGFLLVALSIPKGAILETYGTWNKYVI